MHDDTEVTATALLLDVVLRADVERRILRRVDWRERHGSARQHLELALHEAEVEVVRAALGSKRALERQPRNQLIRARQRPRGLIGGRRDAKVARQPDVASFDRSQTSLPSETVILGVESS